jgi:F-box and WD-40 domain protein CDC4
VLYDRPLSLQQRVLEDDPSRPLSAMAIDYRSAQPTLAGPSRDASAQDVDMHDAGPSTAPLQGVTFFHDD